MNLKLLLVCIVAAMVLVILMKRATKPASAPIVPIKSTIDGRTYYVQDKPDKQTAANMLAQTRAKMIALVECLKSTKGQVEGLPADDVQKYGPYQERVNRLIKRFNPDRIAEGNEDIRYTTFTLNKGEKVVFCLRARDGTDDSVHDLPMMTFVAIHEMGHIASVTEHHTPEFHANFKWLLLNAVKCGIYKPEDFNRAPRNYCGMQVTDTPVRS